MHYKCSLLGLCEERLIFDRSNRSQVLFKKGAVKDSGKFTGKNQCQSLFLNKVASLRTATLFEKRLWNRSSVKQGDLEQFFTRDFLIYKKYTRKY